MHCEQQQQRHSRKRWRWWAERCHSQACFQHRSWTEPRAKQHSRQIVRANVNVSTSATHHCDPPLVSNALVRSDTHALLFNREQRTCETPNPRGHLVTALLPVWGDVGGGWAREESGLRTEHIWTGRSFLPIQMRKRRWRLFWAFSQIKGKKAAHLTHLCLPVYWWCSYRLVGNGEGGCFKYIEGVCTGPSPSLLLAAQIRYSSAGTGGASDETIFLPLFFSTEEAERADSKRRKELTNKPSLSRSLFVAFRCTA